MCSQDGTGPGQKYLPYQQTKNWKFYHEQFIFLGRDDFPTFLSCLEKAVAIPLGLQSASSRCGLAPREGHCDSKLRVQL